MIQAIDIARENDTLRNILLGQPQACQRVERQIRYIVRISYRSFSQDEVNDVVQNVLLNLYSLVSKPEFRLERSLNALIRRITLALQISVWPVAVPPSVVWHRGGAVPHRYP